MSGTKNRRECFAIGRAMALAAVALPLIVMPGCKKAAVPESAVTVQAEQPEQGTITEQVSVDAVLAPQAQAAIQPKIAAPVKKFYVERGQRVHAGELLAELENSDLTGAAMDSQGAYEAAKATYDTATKVQVPADQLKAESDFAQAKANLDLNQSIATARKQLFAQGAISGHDLDTAQAALVSAQAAYNAAKQQLDAMHSVTHEAELKQAQGTLTSAEGKLKNAQAQVSYSEIRSPVDGVVTDRPLFAGEMATPGTPMITVMDTSVLLAKTHIGQAHAQQLKTGSEADVTVPGLKDPVTGSVSLISPALDPGSATVEVWLKIDNKDGKLKAGTPVKVSIAGLTVEKAMKVPLSAVLTADDGSKSVMVIDDKSQAQRKKVNLGITDGTDVQILGGIDPTDQVITVGSYGLDPGTKVVIGKAKSDDDDDAAGGGK